MNKRNLIIILLIMSVALVGAQVYAYANSKDSARNDAYKGRVAKFQSSGEGASAYWETGSTWNSIYVSRSNQKGANAGGATGTRVWVDSYNWETDEWMFKEYTIPDKDFILDNKLGYAKLMTTVADGNINLEWKAVGPVNTSSGNSVWRYGRTKSVWHDKGSWVPASATGVMLGKTLEGTYGSMYKQRSMSISIGEPSYY